MLTLEYGVIGIYLVEWMAGGMGVHRRGHQVCYHRRLWLRPAEGENVSAYSYIHPRVMLWGKWVYTATPLLERRNVWVKQLQVHATSLWTELINISTFQGDHDVVNKDQFCRIHWNSRTKRHTRKLGKRSARKDMWKHFVSNRVVNLWNKWRKG